MGKFSCKAEQGKMHTLCLIWQHTLTGIAIVVMLQFLSADGVRLDITKGIVKAMCIQTKEFATSNNLQGALKDKKQYANVDDGVCAKVTCTIQGGKCTKISERKCDVSGTQSSKSRKGGKRSFDGFKLFSITPKDESQLKSFIKMTDVKFLDEPRKVGVPFVVLFSQEQQQKHLKSDVQSKQLRVDLLQLVQDEAKRIKPAANPGEITWDAYYYLEDIYAFLEKLANDYPDRAKLSDYGKSYENRSLKLVSIKKSQSALNSSGGPPWKPIFFLECNIHARERIASSVCTYIINELVVARKECISSYLDHWDFYVIPVANPDGFKLTFDVNTDPDNRLWRKTLSANGHADPYCRGVDPNRNFDAHWEETETSNAQCSDNYSGPKAASESEVLHLSNLLQGTHFSERLRIYVSFHSYSQLWMWPYGHTTTEKIPEFKFYDEVGQNVTKAIEQRYGTKYTQGPVATTLYEASGSSQDWVYDKVFKGLKEPSIAGAFELRGTATAEFLFMLPPEQIIPTALEIIDGLCVLASGVQPKNAKPDPECDGDDNA